MADGERPVKQTGSKRIGEGKAGPGRPKGGHNKTTTLLKEAIVMAAEAVGSDGAGKNGVVGYCEHLARNEPKAFAALMGKTIPLQVQGGGEDGAIVTEIVIRGVSASR
jgi:hypothetical protein